MILKKVFNLLFRLIFTLVLVSGYRGVSAQEVSISSELTIRNYMAYDLLGRIDDKFIVFRDKGDTKEIDIFDKYLEHTSHTELFFEKRKSTVVHTLGLDTSFQLIYNYVDKDSIYIKMRRYNSAVVLQDSSEIGRLPKKIIRKKISEVTSEDKSKVLIYTLDDEDNFLFFLYDNDRNTLLTESKLAIPDFEPNKHSYELKLTNSGQLLVLLVKPDFNRNAIFSLVHFDLYNQKATAHLLNSEKYQRDYFLDYDNQNDKVIFCGTFSEKRGKNAEGYYIINKRLGDLQLEETAKILPFPDQLIEEVGRSKRKKNKVFQDFTVREVLKRNDGGFLIMMELSKEFSRRNSYSPTTNFDRGSYGPAARRGWVDYYNEDIIVSSISPAYEFDWSKILYKKQFSQDDEAIYSSFFVMKTPSRLRLLYNDEIKKSNTVSEYIMDPTGKIARNSLLSTEDQEMKLRFRDALQISNRELLVPSETNYDLILVKITY